MLINIIKKASFPTIDDSADYLNSLWLDTSSTPNILKQYDSSTEKWENVAFKDIINIRDNFILNIWKGTKEEFELLDILEDNVIYFVTNIGVFIGNSPIFKTDKIIYVNPNYEGNRRLGSSWDFPFGDLQDAIDAAHNGDILWLAKGIYKSDGYMGISFTCNKELTFIGGFDGNEMTVYDRKDPNGTVFSGEGIRSIIKVTSNNVVFDSIEFRNGNINENGGAVYNEISTNTTVKRCKFFNNNAILGGAIYNPYIVTDSLFVGNRCTGNGNAIYLDKFAKIVGNTFVGGITNSCVYSTTNIEFVNNIIWNKNVGGDGIVYNLEGSTIANDASTVEILGDDCILISRTNAGTDKGVNYAKFKSPGENNYELSDDSDLIGKGNANYCLTEFDMNRKPRIIGTKPDLGCYENQSITNLVKVEDIEGLNKNAVGLGNVDNTSDADKPISNDTAAALGTIRNTLDTKADLVNGVIPVTQIPSSLTGDMKFGGVWDAFDNIPHLINGDYTTAGTYYIANTEGIQFGYHFYSGDYCVNDGGVWKKVGHTGGEVKTVNGKSGVVEITINDIPDLRTELDSKADSLQTQQALDNKADLVNGVIPTYQLPSEALGSTPYLGEWDASTNTPQLVIGDTSKNCKYYKVSKMGIWNNISFFVNDLVINLDGNWYKVAGETVGTGTGEFDIENFVPGTVVYEYGSSNTVTLTWDYKGLPEGKNPQLQTINGVTIANNYRTAEFHNVTEDTTFTLAATFNNNTATAVTRVKFLHKLYYGMHQNSEITQEEIRNLNKSWATGGAGIDGKADSENGKYFYVVIPTNLLDNYRITLNNFYSDNYKTTEINLVNEQGVAYPYTVIRFNELYHGSLYYSIIPNSWADGGDDASGAGSLLIYKGTWNAYQNKPRLANGDITQTGWIFRVAIEGEQFGYHFYVDDAVLNMGGNWVRIEGGITN